MRNILVWSQKGMLEGEVEQALYECGIEQIQVTSSWEKVKCDLSKVDGILLIFLETTSPEKDLSQMLQFLLWLREQRQGFDTSVLLVAIEHPCWSQWERDIWEAGIDKVCFLKENHTLPSLTTQIRTCLPLRKGNWTCRSYIYPFIHSTQRIFDGRGVSLTPTPPKYLREQYKHWNALTGVISFAEGVYGSLLVHMAEDVARRIVGLIFGLPDSISRDDVADGIGELTNMIVGNAKREFAKEGMIFRISLPNVIIGEDYHVHRSYLDGAVYTTMVGNEFSFLLSVAMRRDRKKLRKTEEE